MTVTSSTSSHLVPTSSRTTSDSSVPDLVPSPPTPKGGDEVVGRGPHRWEPVGEVQDRGRGGRTFVRELPARPLTPRRCRCGRVVLTGLADGIPATVDPLVLTLPGEIAARLHRRLTFDAVIRMTGRAYLYARYPWHAHRRHYVLGDHACDSAPTYDRAATIRFLQELHQGETMRKEEYLGEPDF